MVTSFVYDWMGLCVSAGKTALAINTAVGALRIRTRVCVCTDLVVKRWS